MPASAPLNDTTIDQLPDLLRDAAARVGWQTLMPVQARAIPYMLAARNIMIQARTGSGKTGAYLLPMLVQLDPKLHHCQALIQVPTRELARQVGQEAGKLCKDTGLRVVVVYGGVGYGAQMEDIERGAHIIVGTPGRTLDLLLRRAFSLDRLQMMIYDEADRMLSMGFYPDMKQIQGFLPKHSLPTCMFSATFPGFVLRTAQEFIREPEFISLSQDHVHVTDTEHVCYIMPGMEKDRGLVRIIEIENPASAIIFCNTKAKVHFVSVVLQRFGYDADELSADLSQKDRERVLERARKGKLRFLVATNLAARGLDIPDLSHVIQYDPPDDPEGYIHRAGRTGRAGAAGVAISLVSDLEKMDLDRIAKRFGIDIQVRPMPGPADVEAIVTERVTALLEARLRQRDKLLIERSQRFVPLGRSLAENEDESAIIAMLLDDYYQQMLHAPLPQPDGAPTAPRAQRPGTKYRSRRPRRYNNRK
jgi:ATP-dependent RNA helicase DeaD